MKSFIQITTACALAAVAFCNAYAEPATGFINFSVEYDGKERTQVVYVPREYDPDNEWPLIVSLHGYGERGDDGLKQTQVGIGRAIRLYADRFPCLVLMPQCPDDSFWVETDFTLARGLKDASPLIDIALNHVRENYKVDANRITLTGLSMGGFATWHYGALNADVYAAFMPVCGGGRLEDVQALTQRPVWAFHGGADTVVLPEKSREMVEALEEKGANVKYTEYDGVGHNSWDKAYGSRRSIAWLLEQRLDNKAKTGE